MAKEDKKIQSLDAREAGKEKAIEEALRQIEKSFGEGAIMRMGDAPIKEVDVIPTGAMSLDIALGIGGIPRGRITEIYGPESSGKTTVALHIIAEAQKQGGEVAFIDAEHALDPIYARNLGVDVDRLIVSQPDSGEDALEITEALARSNAFDVIVVDSVAALVPRAEIEGNMGDSHVGMQARLMSQALRKLTGTINKTKCVAIFINQLREKVGVVYGNPEVTPGGRALKFYSSVRIEIRKGEPIKSGSEVIGNVTKAKIAKNKVAPPFKVAIFDLMYGEGISAESSLVNVGTDMNILEKSGSWYSYKGERIAQGKENVKKYLAENPAVADEIREQIMQNFAEAEKAVSASAAAASTEDDVSGAAEGEIVSGASNGAIDDDFI